MRFILCGGRLKVDVVELGDGEWEVFAFVKNGVYDVVRILERENFVCLESEGTGEKVMSKVVSGNVIDYLTELSVKVVTEMKKWHWHG
jgi:hypothetical protein